MGKDWEEGLHWLMLATTKVTQDSTGFSPNELLFTHTVRGPLPSFISVWPCFFLSVTCNYLLLFNGI